MRIRVCRYNIQKYMNQEDIPLTEYFYENPLEHMQNYVRTMNNEVFLSEFHINNLYALLLISRQSPWDNVSALPENTKKNIDKIVQSRVFQVKLILDVIARSYEDNNKKNALGRIQKIMSIIKANKKSIFIKKIKKDQNQNQYDKNLNIINKNSNEQINKENQQIKQQNTNEQIKYKQNNINTQVISLFSSLSNIANMSTVAMENFIQLDTASRFVTFHMNEYFIITIRNDQPQHYDRTSSLRELSGQILTLRLFPYLTATQLFNMRAVCKEWRQLVKETWHATFKREMLSQLLACQFCKDIQFHYKCIQLRNPFFQKLSLLLHALLQIIQWVNVTTNPQALPLHVKKILLIMLRLIGETVPFTNLQSITDALFLQFIPKIVNIKASLIAFLSNLSGTKLSIQELREIKTTLLDDPFMRVQDVQSEDKTPLLLLIFVKQLTLQQILRNHIFFAQEYLLNIKTKLDSLTARMPAQKNYLERIYKVLLFNQNTRKSCEEVQTTTAPAFTDLITSLFHPKEKSNTADFVITTKNGYTEIYLDSQTKFDIILSTLKSLDRKIINQSPTEHQLNQNDEEKEKIQKQQQQQRIQSEQKEKQNKRNEQRQI